MKNRPINTNLDIYTTLFRAFNQKPAQPPTPEDAMLEIYQGKIIDLYWFEGKLPDKLHQEFSYVLNEDWPYPFELPHNPNNIYKLSLEELIYICGQIKKPAWASSRKSTHCTMSYKDITERWEFI